MEHNSYIKSLKAFNPKKDLTVNETFKVPGSYRRNDTLSELEGDSGLGGEDSGKGVCNYKTSGAISAGMISLGRFFGKEILLVVNKSGEIHLLYPEQGKLKALVTFSVQGSLTNTPGYAAGVLYCAAKEGVLYAVDLGLTQAKDIRAVTPKIIWQKKMRKGVLTEPVATGKILLVAALDGLYAYEAYYQDAGSFFIGKGLWIKGIKGGVVSSPHIHSGIILLGSESCYLYAFEYGGSDVNLRWSYKSSGGIRTRPTVSDRGNLVLFGTLDGYVYCIDFSKGTYKWNYVTKKPCLSTIVSLPVENDEYFYFGADNGIFYCINSRGKEIWKCKTNGKIRTEALVHDNRVYFGSADNHFYCLDAFSGNKIFSFATDGTIIGKPVIVDNVVYFGSTDSFVHGVNI